MRRVLGFMILLTGFTLVYLSSKELLPFVSGKPHERLQVLWEKDIETLRKEEKLPTYWNRISKIHLRPTDNRSEELLKKLKIPFETRKEEAFQMEILFDIWEDLGDKGAFFQYSIIAPDGNTVWELTRTLVYD